MTEAYPPSARVRRRADYRRIQSGRSRVHTRHFLIVLAAAPVGTQRLGVTVTKKVGNAVVRNRIKRVVREVFRRNRELFPDATDVVFIAKQGAGAVRYAELLADEGEGLALEQVDELGDPVDDPVQDVRHRRVDEQHQQRRCHIHARATRRCYLRSDRRRSGRDGVNSSGQ